MSDKKLVRQIISAKESAEKTADSFLRPSNKGKYSITEVRLEIPSRKMYKVLTFKTSIRKPELTSP